MSILNKLGEIAKTVGDKTNDALEQGKASMKIKTEEANFAEQMRKIGEHYYARRAEGLMLEDAVAEACAAADQARDTIEEIRAEQQRQRAEKEVATEAKAAREPVGAVCRGCGTVNPAGTKFCRQCGTPVENAIPTKRVCQNCGAEISPETKFCGECGAKVQ